MVILYTDWVSQESVGDCNNPNEPECNGAVWRFTYTDGSVEDICRDCGHSVQIKEASKKVTNCIYCPEYRAIHSQECQGYMPYCNFLKGKINIYEDYKICNKEGK